MKKFTLALATLALSVASMNATDYYVVGGSLGWGLKNPAGQFTPTATEGVYELKYEGTFGSDFKINDGTWTNPAVNFGSNGSNLVVGEPYTLGQNAMGNIQIEGGNVENPTLTLNVNEGTLLISGQTVESKIGYCLHGSIVTGDESKWDDIELTEDGTKWAGSASILPGSFGIKVIDLSTGAQTVNPETGSNWYGAPDGESTVTLNSSLPVVTSGSVNWDSTLEGDYSFTFDTASMTLIVANASVWNEISADENATFAIYTIEGNLVKASANMNDVENLENGMYIINGGKVMICK